MHSAVEGLVRTSSFQIKMVTIIKVILACVVIGASEPIIAYEVDSEVTDNIQSMALYLSDRLPRELAALQIRKQNATIEMEDLLVFDQMHYDGENAMISAISNMEISSSSRILDVGSGYGGPARYVSWKTGAHVTALELQPEISDEAAKLTKLVGQTSVDHSGDTSSLEDLLDHQVGDVIEWGPATFSEDSKAEKFDGFMSMLAFLHVDDKASLFNAIGRTLKPGARFYIEDYFQRHDLTDNDMKVLKDIVSCGRLPTQQEYTNALETAGYSDIKFLDKTEDWAVFVDDRRSIFEQNKTGRIQVLGTQTYDALFLFYSSVAKLFREGRLGGTVITGVYKGSILPEEQEL